jgi:hypothetical protein
MDTETALVENAFFNATDKRYPENCIKNEKRWIYQEESRETSGKRGSALLQEERWRRGTLRIVF